MGQHGTTWDNMGQRGTAGQHGTTWDNMGQQDSGTTGQRDNRTTGQRDNRTAGCFKDYLDRLHACANNKV